MSIASGFAGTGFVIEEFTGTHIRGLGTDATTVFGGRIRKPTTAGFVIGTGTGLERLRRDLRVGVRVSEGEKKGSETEHDCCFLWMFLFEGQWE